MYTGLEHAQKQFTSLTVKLIKIDRDKASVHLAVRCRRLWHSVYWDTLPRFVLSGQSTRVFVSRGLCACQVNGNVTHCILTRCMLELNFYRCHCWRGWT